MSVINFTLVMYNLCFTSYFNIFNIDVKKTDYFTIENSQSTIDISRQRWMNFTAAVIQTQVDDVLSY